MIGFPRAVRQPSLPADRDHTGALEAKVPIASPDLVDAEAPEKDQTGGVRVGEPVSAEALQLSDDISVVILVDRQELQPGQLAEGEPKGPSRVLPETMEKPPVGLRHDQERGEPPSRRFRKEPNGGTMIAVGSVEERDEDAGVEEDSARPHGRGRP